MRGWLVAAALALAGPGMAETLGPDALRAAGYDALVQGDAPRALDYATALVVRDPGDVGALILESRAARDLGLNDRARAAGKAAWAAADTTAEWHAASLAMAQALSSSGQRGAAQFWLRRAVQTAPNEAARAQAARDFDYVRSRKPFLYRLDVSIAPSSNVNNGTSAQTMEILGFPFTISGDAQALSGVEAMIGFSGRYRFVPGERSATELTFGLQQRSVALSSDAKAIAPQASASDYAFSAIEIGIAHRFRPEGSQVLGTTALTAGHNRYGGDGLSDYLRLDLGAERPFSDRSLGFVTFLAERQYRLDDAERSANVLGLGAGVVQRFGNGDLVRASVNGKSIASDSVEIDHRAFSAAIAWERGRPLGSVAIGASLSVEDLDYPISPYAAGGRQDLRVSADVSVTFLEVGYLGFNPVVNLRVGRTSSNVDLYDQRDLGLTVGIRSAF